MTKEVEISTYMVEIVGGFVLNTKLQKYHTVIIVTFCYLAICGSLIICHCVLFVM